MRCDVLVAGGGAAGLAAAVAAARAGACTRLIERHGALGGMATAALVHSVCGLYLVRQEPGAVLAHTGFPAELAARLLSCGAAFGPARMGRVDVLLHRPAALAVLADRITAETPGLDLRLHTEIVAVTVDDSGAAVETRCRGAGERIEARVVVDATGDAEIARLCGAGFEQEESSRLQRAAMIFLLEGVATEAIGDQARLRLAHRIAAAVRDGELPRGALGASLRATDRPGEVYATIDLEGPLAGPYDPTDPACLTALERAGRALAWELAGFLRRAVEGFERSFVAALPSRVGVRESRRAIGEYRLEAADVEAGARFDDAVALATWPMELREQATGARLHFAPDGRPCEIPLRALRARSEPRLLVAGRCISASHAAQASIRVIGTCLATGEAAGLAAALLADRGVELGATSALAPAVLEARERLMRPRAEAAAGEARR